MVFKMPKTKETKLAKIKRFAAVSNGVLTAQNDEKTKSQVLYCQACYCVVNSDTKSHVDQHLKTANHRKKVKDFKTKQESVQTMLQSKKSDFKSDLCEFLVSCNIPFDRISKPGFKRFFDKYIKFDLPEKSSLWKTYLKPLYIKTIEKIRTELKDEFIWLQIDETEDSRKKKVVNVIVGSLNADKNQCKKFLIDMRFVSSANNFTITQAVTDALTILWPEGIKYEKFLVLITDAVNYMKKAGRALKLIYPNLIHITCVAHGLHNLAQYLMKSYKDVNRLVVCGKKIFLKAPNRVEIFKEVLPNTPLPPEPVPTRWGSWLRGVRYFAQHYELFCQVIKKLKPYDSAFIEEIQELIEKPNLKNELTFIFANFDCLQEAITKLNSNNLSLSESLSILQSVCDQLESNTSPAIEDIRIKMREIFAKNDGLKCLKSINQILEGKTDVELKLSLNPAEIVSFKWCPLTDCDIERSFSSYKFIISDKRQLFEEENLKHYLIIYCNSE